jgi:hypothetical protein
MATIVIKVDQTNGEDVSVDIDGVVDGSCADVRKHLEEQLGAEARSQTPKPRQQRVVRTTHVGGHPRGRRPGPG